MDDDKTRILNADANLQEACEGLRDHVDNINQAPALALRNGVYRGIDKRAIQTVKVSGVEIGYRLQDHKTFMRRQIFIKVPGYKIDDLTHAEREKIITAVFNVFLVPGANLPEIAHIAPDCMLLQQDVVPLILVERNPNVRSLAGGFGKLKLVAGNA